MAHISPDALELVDHGPVELRDAELDGITLHLLHFTAPVDMSVMLRGLPGDVCHCPHWGIVTEGSMTVRYADQQGADHEEVVGTGDVFCMPPGHVPTYEVGTRLIQFSPTDQMRIVDAVIERNMRALQGA